MESFLTLDFSTKTGVYVNPSACVRICPKYIWEYMMYGDFAFLLSLVLVLKRGHSPKHFSHQFLTEFQQSVLNQSYCYRVDVPHLVYSE